MKSHAGAFILSIDCRLSSIGMIFFFVGVGRGGGGGGGGEK